MNMGHSNQTEQIQPPNGNEGPSTSGRLAHFRHFRQSYNAEGLSDRSSENCGDPPQRQHTNPLGAPVSTILEFLLHQYETGKMYHTINTMRSAISMTHNKVDGVQHAFVTRFLKGIYNCRPPCPKYLCTWNVDIVLDYIAALDLSYHSSVGNGERFLIPGLKERTTFYSSFPEAPQLCPTLLCG